MPDRLVNVEYTIPALESRYWTLPVPPGRPLRVTVEPRLGRVHLRLLSDEDFARFLRGFPLARPGLDVVVDAPLRRTVQALPRLVLSDPEKYGARGWLCVESARG